MNITASTKRYIGDDRFRVRLFEAVAQQARLVVKELDGKDVKASTGWSEDECRRRIGVYDETWAELCQAEALIGRWGTTGSRDTLTHAIKRICDGVERGGNTGWLRLQWYPALLLFYAGGIGAVSAGRFETLMALMHAPVSQGDGTHAKLVLAVTDGLSDGTQFFKLLPGLDRKYVPCSEHLFEVLGKLQSDVLYLGSDFELSFDTFEIFVALEYAHLSDRGWGPIGRFGWRSHEHGNAWQRLITESQAAGDSWAPLAAGLCGGSSARLKAAIEQLQQAVSRARWQ